ILSPADPAPGFLNYPWEITYGPDNNLWVTEARAYKLSKIDPNTGTKTTVLDLSMGSTWLTTNGAPAGSDTLAAIATNTWNGPWPIGTSTNPIWPQGGFAGMALHPNFLDGSGTKDFVYITYVHRYVSGGGAYAGIRFRNKIVRFTYNSGTQKFSSPVIIANDLPGSTDHNSQRMIIAPVGGVNYLFMASGDMGAGQFGNRDKTNNAQNSNSLEGKILRYNLESDGDAGDLAWIPNDNPYGATNPVWSIGIRNNQGLAYDPATGFLYGSSHGPYSDDEINIIEAGKNYGHPLVIGYSSDGNYNGTTAQPLNTSVTAGAPFSDPTQGVSGCPPIGNEAANAATIGITYRDPIFSAYASSNATIKTSWKNQPNVPNAGWESEAWSGLDLYTNTVIPGWKRSLIASGLKWGRMIRLKLGTNGTTTLPSNLSQNNTGDTVTYFQSGNRYRDLAYGPNGKDIYLVMDNSSATSGPGVGNPTVPACPGCLIKYTFLGYVKDGSSPIEVSTIPKSIDVTTGPVNTCNTANTVTIDATNNNLWVPITGSDGNILAEINANGNNLGTVTSSFYKNSGAIRVRGGVRYLDRNITITPQNPPSTPVKVRLYLSKTEFDALDADPLSAITSINDLKVLKNNDPCGAAIASSTTLFTPENTTLSDLQHGANGYVLQINISSFSTFYFAASNITLPLDLITFTGTLQSDKSTLLKWRTENEINTSHFVVERSTDGNNYTAIGTVSAYNASAQNYSLVDYDAANQQSLLLFYRLKMYDRDGAFKYSNVVTVSLADIAGAVKVSPNPVTNEARITIIPTADGKVQYKLIDNTGRTILQKSTHVRKGTQNTVAIDMSTISVGTYYLKVTGAGLNNSLTIQKQ
ncbi:MAG: PQQ-dependent sugar dehydrogenase, partial [Chitinophagaceae bacterium]